MIDQFKIKDVRCFAGEQYIQVRPLTLLVGENSTGKTTLLGCYHAWMQFLSSIYMASPEMLPLYLIYRSALDFNFNADPYQMGENIARRPRRPQGKSAKFSIGTIHETAKGTWKIDATFEEEYDSGPHLEEIIISFPAGARIIYRINKTKPTATKHARIALNKKNNELIIDFTANEKGLMDFEKEIARFTRANMARIPSELQDVFRNPKLRRSVPRPKQSSIPEFILQPERIANLAPVRSQPKRTYDSISELPDPKGDDIPMYMMRLARDTSTQKWKTLQKNLAKFGEDADMFKSVEIEKLGRDMSAFQIKIDMGHRKENIMDVGYGISQILPILVRMMSSTTDMMGLTPFGDNLRFLLQQPEVHLHPQAQAAFASLVASVVSSDIRQKKYGGWKGFLIETHSDYMINRIQLEIRNKTISPKNVSLVYHEKTGTGAKIHNITFDKRGDLQGVPPNYRDFFLDEAEKLVGF